MLGKVLASSLTLSIGGSGGVFAPSLFIGAMARNGIRDRRPPPIRALGRAAGTLRSGGDGRSVRGRRPSAADGDRERRGDDRQFRLTLPIMLACGIAAAVSKHLSYGSIYTTKLLRRGIDIERPKTTNVLQRLTVADVMQPIPQPRRPTYGSS